MKFAFSLICLVVAVFIFESTEGCPENANAVEIFQESGERECGKLRDWCTKDKSTCCSTFNCVCNMMGNCRCMKKK
uniref:U16-Deinotoxin-Dsu1a_1 n=1 Tax=Deinopis subrufa TaxID=1905329 RepID=A0A4Q8KD28_DEISU